MRLRRRLPRSFLLISALLTRSARDLTRWAVARSNQRCKEHAWNVFSAAGKILETELRTKGLLERRDPAAAAAVVAVLGALRDGWRGLCAPSSFGAGYELQCVFDFVREADAAFAAKDAGGAHPLPGGTRAELRALCAALHAEAGRYGMGERVGDAAALFA